jgi:hypothetical protein
MTTYDENRLAALFTAEAPTPLPGDWEDVLGRASATRRRLRARPPFLGVTGRSRFVVVLVATGLVVIVGAAAALGIRALLADRGFIGLPPPGAVASVPEQGKVVLRASGRCTAEGSYCFVWAFSDGRLIWGRDASLLPYGANDRTTGLLEQRLTSRGIKLLRSAFGSTGACTSPRPGRSVDCIPSLPGPAPFPAIAHPGWKDVSWGLPPYAWKEVEITAFVPARFAFCFVETYRLRPGYWLSRTIDLRRLSPMLPTRAAAILREGTLLSRIPPFGADASRCIGLTTAEARRLANVLDRARMNRPRPTYVLLYQLDVAPGVREEIWFAPMLPNGEWVRSGGG